MKAVNNLATQIFNNIISYIHPAIIISLFLLLLAGCSSGDAEAGTPLKYEDLKNALDQNGIVLNKRGEGSYELHGVKSKSIEGEINEVTVLIFIYKNTKNREKAEEKYEKQLQSSEYKMLSYSLLARQNLLLLLPNVNGAKELEQKISNILLKL